MLHICTKKCRRSSCKSINALEEAALPLQLCPFHPNPFFFFCMSAAARPPPLTPHFVSNAVHHPSSSGSSLLSEAAAVPSFLSPSSHHPSPPSSPLHFSLSQLSQSANWATDVSQVVKKEALVLHGMQGARAGIAGERDKAIKLLRQDEADATEDQLYAELGFLMQERDLLVRERASLQVIRGLGF